MRWFLLLLSLLLLWQCSTTKAPPERPSPPAPAAEKEQSVSRAEFFRSHWSPQDHAPSWMAIPGGVQLNWSDGRRGIVRFLTPFVAEVWIPATPSDVRDPAQMIDSTTPPEVQATLAGSDLLLHSAGASLTLHLVDLSWSLLWGDQSVVTAGPLRRSGNRSYQTFDPQSSSSWSGPGLLSDQTQVKFWSSSPPLQDAWGPWVAPALLGQGGHRPFVCFLDSAAASYSRHDTETGLGSLSGGFDLLVATAETSAEAAAQLSEVTGRLPTPPRWALETMLAPATSPSLGFVRSNHLSIGAALGAAVPGFRRVEVGDMDAATSSTGYAVELAAWKGASPSASRANNLVPVASAFAAQQAQLVSFPRQRTLVLAPSAGLGTVRTSWPELAVSPSRETQALSTILSWGLAGQGTPAVRVDLTGLSDPLTREATFRCLTDFLLAPILIADLGPQPDQVWGRLSPDEQQRLRRLIAVRSQFLPFLQLGVRDMTTTGKPFWQGAASDPVSSSAPLALRMGPLLQVTLDPQAKTQRVKLPGHGVWFNFWTGEELAGGQEYDLDVPTDSPLLFVQGGGFVAVTDPETFDGKDVYHAITVHVFPGGRGQSVYRSDDGLSDSDATGEYWESQLLFNYDQRTMSLTHESVHPAPTWRADPFLLYRIHNVYKPRRVAINGKPVPLYGDSWGITDSDRSAAWYESDHSLLIKTFHPERSQEITMEF